MKRFYRILWIVLPVILFAGVWCHDLRSGDETRQAGIAAAMLLEHDWLIPRLNGLPFLEYPPLHAWGTAAMFALFGLHAFAAKLISLLAAGGTLLLTMQLGKKLHFQKWQWALSGLILLSSIPFFSESRNCRVDMLLTFCITLAVAAFYHLTAAEARRGRIGWWLPFVLGLAGGIAAKGLIGAAVPAAVIGGWLAAADVAAKKFRFGRWLAALGGGIAALALIAIWYVAIWRTGGDAMLKIVLYDNNLGRFLRPTADHAEPCWYYIAKLPELFHPWLLLFFIALYLLIRRKNWQKDEGLLLLLAGALIPFLLLSAASAKRTVYLLPIFPFWALLCGAALPLLPERFRSWWTPRRSIILLLIFAGLLILIDGVVGAVHARRESLQPLFAAAQESEASGKKVFLAAPQERTSGAAVFYLHHRVPAVSIKSAMGLRGGECRILRSRDENADGIPFNDSHYLQMGKEGGL